MITFQIRFDSLCDSFISVFMGLACLTGLCIFAPSTKLAQSPAQRDQQARAIIMQTILVGRGSDLLASIQDLTETANVALFAILTRGAATCGPNNRT